MLRERRGGNCEQGAGEDCASDAHRPAISPSAGAAASAALLLLATACSDALGPGGATLSTAELLILPQQAGAPAPPSSTFEVCNDMLTVEVIMHPSVPAIDYLEVRFPMGSLSALNGTPLSTTDCVNVTVQPRAGAYGFSLSPQGLEFVLDATPTATLLYDAFGDFSVVDDSPTYDTAQQLENALDIWEEVTVDRWRVARGSGSAGLGAVSAAIDAPGNFVLAAPR